MRTNPIRFTGMASGMDTDSIVRDMMRPQKYKIDQEKKAQALIQLRQDAWKDMNKKLSDFHRNFTEKMSRGSTYNKTNATSSDSSALEIKSDAVIPPGTHVLNITQLAESARTVGRGESGTGIAKGATVASLMGEEVTVPEKLVMKVNGKRVEVKVAATDNLSKVAAAMNESLEGTGFRASYNPANGSFFVNSTITGQQQTIDFDPTFTGEDAGKESADSVAFFEKLGVSKWYNSFIQGKDAVYSYNGAEGFTSSTNAIKVNGVEVTLKAANTGPVTISAELDPDATYNFVKEFVTEYNKLIDEVNEKLSTKPGKDIMPLTAEERESMSESDIKLWEDKLNKSLFYQDTDLASFVDSARRTLGQVLGGVEKGGYNSLASLGIVTGSWQDKGKLYIMGDEDSQMHSEKPNKLREALAENPNKVTEFFKKMGSDLYTTHNKVFSVGNKLKSAMNFYNDKVMVEKVTSYEKRISVLEERMYQMEDRQYAKFAAMEKMLSTLNSQGSWLAQQFGGM